MCHEILEEGDHCRVWFRPMYEMMMTEKYLATLKVAEGCRYDIDIEPDDTKSPKQWQPSGNRIIKAT